MALQAYLRPFNYLTRSARNYSGTVNFIHKSVDDKSGIVTLTMQKQPVNSLNYEILKEFNTVLNDLQSDKARGLILTSSLKTIFSGGLDIMEMYKPDTERVKAFWIALQDAWLTLYSAPYPTVAAINGHSPAGGCLLAMSCEYRIMVKNYTIGLNETKLGMIAPFWFMAVMNSVIGTREHELALTTGKLYTTEEAFKIKLIDEIVDNKEDALARSHEFFQRFKGIHPMARSFTKLQLREKLINEFENRRDEDLQRFVTFVQDPTVQKGIDLYLQTLKKK